MSLKRRQFTREFRLQVLQEADAGKTISQLAREHQDHLTLIHRCGNRFAFRVPESEVIRHVQGARFRSYTSYSDWPRTS